MKFLFLLLGSITLIDAQDFILSQINIESSKVDSTQQELPYTADIYSEEKIQTYQVKDIKELSSISSNTNISGIGNRSDYTFTIRGISNYLASESSVSIYVDDAPIPFSYGFGSIDMNNIKSIEFLKGPQGTLFGKGAQSGVMSLYTKEPSDTQDLELKIGLGEYNTQNFYTRVSTPTPIENLNFSASITNNKHDGFTKNTLTGNMADAREFTSFNTKLHYKPSPNITLKLSYTKTKADDGGSAYKLNTKDDPFHVNTEPEDDFVKTDTDLVSAVLKFHQANSTLTLASSYGKIKTLQEDYVGVLGGLQRYVNTNIEEFSQEVRYKYTHDNTQYLIGLFYSDKFNFDFQENQRLNSLNIWSNNDLDNPDKTYAAFTQIKHMINDNYEFTAGLRYEVTKRSFTRDFNTFGTPSTNVSAQTTWKTSLPSISLSYFTDEEDHVYLTYSKGYRPGGYNYRLTSLVPYEPEKLNSYELGYKANFANSTQINTALFYNIIKDHRVNVFINDNLSTQTYNANKANTYGFELDLTHKYKNTDIYASLGLTRAQYVDFEKDGVTYNGNTLLEVPDMTASLGFNHKLSHQWAFEVSAKYMGKRYYNVENTQKENAYTVVDAKVKYAYKSWEANLYINNIFDKEYVDFMIASPSNNYYHFGQPRLVGINLMKTF